MKLDFSIIIPVKEQNSYLKKNIDKIIGLKTDKTFEILIIPNYEFKHNYNSKVVKIISSGKVGPARKRDLAAKIAKGDLLVFLDDDSFPEKDYLEVAYDIFEKNKNLVAAGGPGILPKDQNFFGKVLGSIFISKIAGGYPERYLSIKNKISFYTDDWPSVNMIIKKNFFEKIGGFDCNYWPGEDTILSLKILNNEKKILYAPNLIVNHYRRGDLFSHVKQISAYAKMRGYFVKKYKKNSLKLNYFIPSIFLIYLIFLLITSLFTYNSFLMVPLYFYGFYLLIALLEISLKQKLIFGLLSIPIIIITHIIYGFNFIKGLLTLKDPEPKLR